MSSLTLATIYSWRTRLLHLGAAANYLLSLGWRRCGFRAVQPLGAAGLASNKANKGHPVVTNLGDMAADPDVAIWSSGVRGLAPLQFVLFVVL